MRQGTCASASHAAAPAVSIRIADYGPYGLKAGRLKAGNWRPETGDWKLETGDWKLEAES